MTALLNHRRRYHVDATARNVELALRRAISAMAGKNVSDNEKQHAIRDCEKALEQVRSK
jgi:hypothetical protein